MEKQKMKFKRSAELIAILSKYGFNEFLIQTKLKKAEDLKIYTKESPTNTSEIHLYERIRMAIEELGATFIKLGQTFSNREDLLPEGLILELKKLQDKVEPISLDIRPFIEQQLEIDSKLYFKSIDESPLASASISQVYKAFLSDGTPVILKIKRPGIRAQVVADLLLMKDIAKILVATSETFRKIRLLQVIESFEKSIFEELSFYNEIHNIEQFAQNFKDNPNIFTLKAYRELSNDAILCMDFVDGIKISDKKAIESQGLVPATIAQKGLDLYMTQVIEHGFFHADPHPGNIFVLPNSQIAFIDFGSMGKMLPKDKELLEDFIMNFIAKDTKRLIRTIKKMALEVNIEDEDKLEREIAAIFELLDNDSLVDLDLKVVLKKFTNLLNNNDVLMPEYLYLLIRGIILIEGIGRTLDPQMNLINSVRPYIKKIVKRRLDPNYIFNKLLHTFRDLHDNLSELPENTNQILTQLKEGKLTIQQENKDLAQANKAVAAAINRLAYTVLISGGYIASALLIFSDKSPKIFNISLFGILGLVLSTGLSIIILLSIFKKVK